MQRPWVWILLAAPMVLVISFFVMMLTDSGERQIRSAPTRVSGEAAIGGPFTLVNHLGETVTDESFRGRAMLIYFGFTYCPDICPFSLQIMAAAMEQLTPEERARVQPLLITVDPRRDTVEQLAQYVDSPAFPENLMGLTGTEEQVREAAAQYRVVYRINDEDDPENYLVDHSSIIYLMGSDGRFVDDVFAHGSDPASVASRLQQFLEEEDASS